MIDKRSNILRYFGWNKSVLYVLFFLLEKLKKRGGGIIVGNKTEK